MAEDTNVIPFPGETRLDYPPEDMLQVAMTTDWESVVIIGRDSAGRECTFASHSYLPDVLWHLERAKLRLLRMADECECCDPDNGAA